MGIELWLTIYQVYTYTTELFYTYVINYFFNKQITAQYFF